MRHLPEYLIASLAVFILTVDGQKRPSDRGFPPDWYDPSDWGEDIGVGIGGTSSSSAKRQKAEKPAGDPFLSLSLPETAPRKSSGRVAPRTTYRQQSSLQQGYGSTTNQQAIPHGSNGGASYQQAIPHGSNGGASYQQATPQGSYGGASYQQATPQGSYGSAINQQAVPQGSYGGATNQQTAIQQASGGAAYQQHALHQGYKGQTYTEMKAKVKQDRVDIKADLKQREKEEQARFKAEKMKEMQESGVGSSRKIRSKLKSMRAPSTVYSAHPDSPFVVTSKFQMVLDVDKPLPPVRQTSPEEPLRSPNGTVLPFAKVPGQNIMKYTGGSNP